VIPPIEIRGFLSSGVMILVVNSLLSEDTDEFVAQFSIFSGKFVLSFYILQLCFIKSHHSVKNRCYPYRTIKICTHIDSTMIFIKSDITENGVGFASLSKTGPQSDFICPESVIELFFERY
jgi:hypothetical protein